MYTLCTDSWRNSGRLMRRLPLNDKLAVFAVSGDSGLLGLLCLPGLGAACKLLLRKTLASEFHDIKGGSW